MTDTYDDDRDLGAKGPDAFRTISEVAEDLGLPQHVLRFWETRFPQIRPIKRGGGRRYYRPADIDLLRGVKQLLYGEGYTIRGVQRILREQGGRKLAQAAGARSSSEGASPIAAEAAPSAPAAGPELWASGRRAAQAPSALETDPDDDDDAYGQQGSVEPVRDVPAERRPGLTQDQIARLSSVIGELRACRRMIDERS